MEVRIKPPASHDVDVWIGQCDDVCFNGAFRCKGNFDPVLVRLIVQCVWEMRVKPRPDVLREIGGGENVSGILIKLSADRKRLCLKVSVELQLMFFCPSDEGQKT